MSTFIGFLEHFLKEDNAVHLTGKRNCAYPVPVFQHGPDALSNLFHPCVGILFSPSGLRRQDVLRFKMFPDNAFFRVNQSRFYAGCADANSHQHVLALCDVRYAAKAFSTCLRCAQGRYQRLLQYFIASVKMRTMPHIARLMCGLTP